jgi:cytosine/adenosine deaminase-related metal-dependent hydrolase
MEWQKFSAERIFDGSRFVAADTVVIVDRQGKIEDLVPAADAGDDVQHLQGILLPGLINAHCHLELSHFKGLISPGGGLVHFLLSVVGKRKEPWQEEWKRNRIAAAAAEMKAGGIVGIGDICNTEDAIEIKLASGLRWHSLVEVLNFSDETLAPRMAHNQKVLDAHQAAGLASSNLTAHAPYSVSPETFAVLNKATAGKIISVHNQETGAEDELFLKGGGDFRHLYALTGTAPMGPSGSSSLQTWLPYFTERQTIILVHNTYTSPNDVVAAQAHAARHGLQLYFCLCPNANLYIENRLPPAEMFLAANCKLLLGTDSYSSNWQLSLAAEIKALAKGFPQVPLELWLSAATQNGAEAFGWKDLGKLAPGTHPGLTLLHTNEQGVITGTSSIVQCL